MYPVSAVSFAAVTRRTRFSTGWASKLVTEFEAVQQDYLYAYWPNFNTLAEKLTELRQADGQWKGLYHTNFTISAANHHTAIHASSHVNGVDDIQVASVLQAGIMSATQAAKLTSCVATATKNRLVQSSYAGTGGLGAGSHHIDVGFPPQWVRLMRDTSSNGTFSIYAWHWKKSVSSPLTEFDSGNRVTALFDLIATGNGFDVMHAADEAGKPYVWIAAG